MQSSLKIEKFQHFNILTFYHIEAMTDFNNLKFQHSNILTF